MNQIYVKSKGKTYRVNAPSSEDVGNACSPGSLWMQSTDLLWYSTNLTGTSSSNNLSIYVNQTPLNWVSPGGQDYGYQLLACIDNNATYQVYLSGSTGDVSCSISQIPWAYDQSNTKPYLLLQSLSDEYFYPIYARSGSIYLFPNPNEKVWLNNTSPPPPAPLYAGSIAFNSASAYLTASANTDFNLGTGDFTVEWFQYQLHAPGVDPAKFPRIFSIGSYAALDDMISATQELDASVSNMYYALNDDWQFTPINIPLTNYLNRWCHFAYCRSGSNLQLFKDGVAITNTATNSSNLTSVKPLYIGAEQGDESTTEFPGFITNFHFVKGQCLYTGSICTVPTSPITPTTGTKLLLLAATSASALTDFSGTNKKLKQIGVVGWSPKSPFK